jgi:hypothetical protein
MMIVSESKKYIFIHIPKTGGTTITEYLDIWGAVSKKYWGHMAHYGMKDLANQNLIMSDISAYAIVAFSRNPYDRIYSCYKFIKEVNVNFISFKTFLENIQNGVISNPMTMSMSEIISANDLLKNSNITVYKYENFDTEFANMVANIGIPLMNIKSYNVSTSDAQVSDLGATFKYKSIFDSDPSLVSLVNEIYEIDFTSFGYNFYVPVV